MNSIHNVSNTLNLRISYLFAFIMVFACVFQSSSQQLPFTHLNISDGLEDNVILSIEQDKKGFLWIATRTGINRFDGKQFWKYGEEEGLPYNFARDLLKIKDGTLWIASERGVAWFDGTKFNTLKDWPNKTPAREIVQAADGTLWVATYGAGILQISTGKEPKIINQYNIKSGLPSESIRSILLDDKDNIWLAMSNKLVLISNGEIQQVEWNIQKSEISTIFQHSDGTIWLGTRNGVAYYNEKSIEYLDLGFDLSKQTINTITEDHSGNVWLGTRGNGAYKIQTNGQYTYIDISGGLSSNSINTIFQDNEGNMWFGTYGGGVSRLSTSKVLNWKALAGMTNPNVYAIVEDEKGCYWFGTNNGASQLCDDHFTTITKEEGLSDNKVLSSVVDNNGELWFGTLDGLSHYSNDKFINYDEKDGISGMVTYHVIQAKDNSYWIGTNKGLNHLVGDKFNQFSKKDGLIDNRVNKIVESKNGGLWLATANGLSRFYEGKFSSWTNDDGLPANWINDIYEDNMGGLWIASGKGLGYFKNGEFKKWTIKDGLPHNSCTVILPGNNGEIWIGTTRGVSIFDGENFTVITSKEGLVSDSINRGAGYRDSQGNNWFGTNDGVSRFSADYKLEVSDPPPVHMLLVSNNENVLLMDEAPEIKQGDSSLLFEFSAISFKRAPDVQYRYRLSKNGSANWRETRLRQIQIDSMAAGNYDFEVTARIGRGQWNPNPATFTFTVTPPFWKTWWFILMAISMIVAVLIYRNLLSRRHAAHLESMVSKRTSQLEESNQGLKWLANHDSLTRLANRNYVRDRFSKLNTDNTSQQLGVIMIDLDFFKEINDRYGHTVGDKALQLFAKMLEQLIQGNQIAARWGGEEFLIVCPQITEKRLQSFAEKVLHNCRSLIIPVDGETNIQLRCSLGIALSLQDKQQFYWEKAIQLADLALYDAKNSGRDCAVGYMWRLELGNCQINMNKALVDHHVALKQGLLSRIEIK